MFRQTKIELHVLNPDVVTWFRSLPSLEGDRDQTAVQGQQRIAWLTQLCKDGEFYSPDWSIATWNGQEYRVNGGHSSAMLAGANGSFPRNLPVIIRWFRCDAYLDVVELFNHFDNRKSNRTAADKAKVHKSIHQELSRVAPSYINRLLNGIQCYYANGESTRGDEDERTALIHTETDFLAWAGPFVRCRALGRSGVIACMYRSYYASPSLADSFWSMVFQESASTPDHPTRVLASFLNSLDAAPAKGKWDSRAIYVKCIHAWNAWQMGTGTTLNYHPQTGIPDLVVITNGRSKSY